MVDKNIDADIAEYLTSNPVGRRATITDVARLARVSKKTVSRVINDSELVRAETRDIIRHVVDKLGYVPDPQARGLAFRKSFLIGMIYDNPNPQYVVNMQEGILEGLQNTHYELAVHRCDRSDPGFLDKARLFAERQKLFGVVLTPSASEDNLLAQAMQNAGCRVVRVASVALDDMARMIVSNDRIGGRAAADHLISLGHSKIALIEGLQGFRSAEERRRGFEEGLAAAGVSLPSQYRFQGSYTYESGIEAAERLLSLRDRPTAVFAANDQMAAGVLHALRKRNLIAPDDLSVVGYDDFQVAVTTSPRLTTIHSPTKEIGRLAAAKLTNESPEGAELDETEPWLVLRESAGPPKNTK